MIHIPWYHSIIVIHPLSFSTIYFTIFDDPMLTRYFISISCIFRFLNELRIYNKNTSYKICDIQFSRFPFLVRNSFLFILDFLWIDYIISFGFYFVKYFLQLILFIFHYSFLKVELSDFSFIYFNVYTILYIFKSYAFVNIIRLRMSNC